MRSVSDHLGDVNERTLLRLLGGYDGKAFSSVVEIFDPEKGQWSYGAPLLQERSGHGSALTVEPTIPDDD